MSSLIVPTGEVFSLSSAPSVPAPINVPLPLNLPEHQGSEIAANGKKTVEAKPIDQDQSMDIEKQVGWEGNDWFGMRL